MSQDVEKFQKENGVAFDPEENSAISSTSDRLIQKGNSTKKPVNFFSLSLFFLLGVAPWLTTNGIWMQLPIFVLHLPEKESIAAYLSISLQISNLFTLIYVILQHYKPIKHMFTISLILVFSIAVCISLTWLWNLQISSTFSFGVMIATFCSGLVGCVSVVLFYPFASLYNFTLISALSTGMGANGLIASILALIENPGSNPRFSIEIYFLILSSFLFLSFISFIVILRHPKVYQYLEREEIKFYMPLDSTERNTKQILLKSLHSMLNQLFIGIMYYLILGIIPFCTIGYSNQDEVLLWMNVCGISAGAITRLLSGYYRWYQINFLSTSQIFFFIFLLLMAIFHPTHAIPAWITVIVYVIFNSLYGYEDTLIYLKVSVDMLPHEMELSSRFIGLSNQFGACVGSVIAFLLIYFDGFNYS